jgi:hypothetical protein
MVWAWSRSNNEHSFCLCLYAELLGDSGRVSTLKRADLRIMKGNDSPPLLDSLSLMKRLGMYISLMDDTGIVRL